MAVTVGSYVVTSIAGQRLVEKLEPWMTEDLARYCQAVGARMIDPALELAEEQGTPGAPGYVPPYGAAFNPAIAPARAVTWLGQFAGVAVPSKVSTGEARSLIKEEAGLRRGTLSSIRAAVERNLSGAKSVIVNERTESNGAEYAYWFTVVVNASEVVSKTALVEAVEAVKPAGVWWTLYEASGKLWSSETKKWSEDAFAWDRADIEAG